MHTHTHTHIVFGRFAAMLRSPWLSLWPTLLFCYKGARKTREYLYALRTWAMPNTDSRLWMF